MKIICVGFWKTGTKSMSQALKILGYNVYDYEEQLVELKDLWKKFFDGTITDSDIHDALDNIDVLIDGPTIVFWNEIYRVFPEAKVILTMRDEEGWWKSFKGMNDKFYSTSLLRFAVLLSPTGYSFANFARKIFLFAYGIDNFGLFAMSWHANERLYKLKYRMHNSHVLQTVSSDALLIHKSADGWTSLCEYLDKEVPSVPYPHKNKNASLFHEDLKSSPLLSSMLREMFISVSVIVLWIVILIWYFVAS